MVSIWMNSSLQDLQQGLLHAFTAHIAGDGGVLALAGDLVDLVDIDNTDLRLLHIKIRCLDQLEQDVLHILAHIAGLGQGGGIGDREGDAQHLGQRLGQQGLAHAGGAQQQHVGLLQFHVAALAAQDALVVVVDRNSQHPLCLILPDDVLIQAFLDLRRGHDVDVQVVSGLQAAGTARTCTRCTAAGRTLRLVGKQVVAQADALTADVDAGADDHAFHFVLVLSTEAADQILLVFVSAGIVICHSCFSLSWINWCQRNDQRWVMTSSISPYSFASSADI